MNGLHRTICVGLVLSSLLAGRQVAAAEGEREVAAEINKANGLLRSGDVDGAVKAYRQVQDGAPDRADLSYNMAVAQYRKGDMAAAEQLFNQAASAEDDALAAKARYNLGNCNYAAALRSAETDRPAAIKSLEKAIENYRRALEVDSNDADSRANIELASAMIDKLREQDKKQQQEKQKQDQKQQDQKQDQKQENNKQQENQDKKDSEQQQNKDQQQSQQNQQQKPDSSQEKKSQGEQGSQDQQQEKKDDKPKDQSGDKSEPKSQEEKSKSEQKDSKSQSQEDKSQDKSAADKPAEQSQQQQSQAMSKQKPKDRRPEQADGKQAEEAKDQKGNAAPKGALSAADQKADKTDPQAQEVAGQPEVVKEGEMTVQEAQKMLQAIRDQEMLRRLKRQATERNQHVPVDRDW